MTDYNAISNNDSSLFLRVSVLLVGAGLFKFGFGMLVLGDSFTQIYPVITALVFYMLAFACAGIAIVSDNIERWVSVVAYGVTGVLCTSLFVAVLFGFGPRYGTDSMLFAEQSVQLVLNGQNPFTAVFTTEFNQPLWGSFPTFLRNGSHVTSLSYPALSFLYFIPQGLLGIPNLNLTVVVVFSVVLLYLTVRSPRQLILAPILLALMMPSIVLFSAAGVFDILWVLPILLAMHAIEKNRFNTAMVLIGLAFATKQTPWMIAPFIGIWIYHESSSVTDAVMNLTRSGLIVLTAFIIPNLPFMVWDFTAWVTSVATPLASTTAPLVKQGNGPVSLAVTGHIQLTKSFFTTLLFVCFATALSVYTLYIKKLKWIAWIIPAIVLWANYRSLQNYFVFFVPIAYQALLIQYKSSGSLLPNQKTTDEIHVPSPAQASMKTRRKLLAGILGSASFITASSFLQDVNASSAKIRIENIIPRDPQNLFRVTHLSVTIKNNESEPIEPRFHTLHNATVSHFYWKIVDGPEQVKPSETATFIIQSPEPQAAFPYKTEGLLRINDVGDDKDVIQQISGFNVPEYTNVLNPDMSYWTVHQTKNTHAPYRWIPEDVSEPIEQTENGYVRLRTRSGEQTILRQVIPFKERLTIEMTPETVLSKPSNIGNESIVSVRLTHRENPRIRVVPTDINERESVVINNVYTILVPATAGQKQTVTVPIQDIYAKQGYTEPPMGTRTIDAVSFKTRTLGLEIAGVGEGELQASGVFHQLS